MFAPSFPMKKLVLSHEIHNVASFQWHNTSFQQKYFQVKTKQTSSCQLFGQS